MSDLIPMTRKGYDKIKGELDNLEQVEMPKIAQRIANARSEGDLSENAEYHGARESQGLLQAKINVLSDKLARASIVDTSKTPRDQVAFGATVIVKDLDFGDEETFVLVGAGEEDYDAGKINVTSPLAQGLMGTKVGQKVEIPVPGRQNEVPNKRDSLRRLSFAFREPALVQRRANPHDGGSFFDRDFKVAAHSHRKFLQCYVWRCRSL